MMKKLKDFRSYNKELQKIKNVSGTVIAIMSNVSAETGLAEILVLEGSKGEIPVTLQWILTII